MLAELGQRELALAAFEGALRFHAGYADAHYHLARTLDEMGRRQQAEEHWRLFLLMAPDSPWAEEGGPGWDNRAGIAAGGSRVRPGYG